VSLAKADFRVIRNAIDFGLQLAASEQRERIDDGPLRTSEVKDR
jgi:hypothetical protein